MADAIQFASVGKTTRSLQSEAIAVRQVTPIGIKTPLRRGSSTIFEMHTDLFEQIRDNLRNLVMTNWGERLGLYHYGANLRELTAERLSREDHDQEVAFRIKSAVERWMSFLSLETLLPLDDSDEPLGRSRSSTIPLRRYLLSYSVPSINSPKQSLEIILGLA